MKNTPEVRIVKLPNFRAISSGYDTFENIFSKDGDDDIKKGFGYHQLEIYVPIKLKGEK